MMMAPTSRRHNLILQQIEKALVDKIDSVVWREEIGINVDGFKSNPDIFIGENIKWNSETCVTAPDFIIEVLSPATARIDKTEKVTEYKRIGVKEYLIVSQERLVIAHNFINNTVTVLDTFKSDYIDNLELDFENIYNVVDYKLSLLE